MDELTEFAQRIRNFNITFHLTDHRAEELSGNIRGGVYSSIGIPPTIRFDRIDISNMGDAEYLGVPRAITDWGPFLKDTEHATLLGHFVNWARVQKGSHLNNISEQESKRIFQHMTKDGRVRHSFFF